MILSLESFIQSDKEQLYSMMVHLRSSFLLFLSNQANFTKASVEGSVSGVIDEVSPPICLSISICLSVCLIQYHVI